MQLPSSYLPQLTVLATHRHRLDKRRGVHIAREIEPLVWRGYAHDPRWESPTSDAPSVAATYAGLAPAILELLGDEIDYPPRPVEILEVPRSSLLGVDSRLTEFVSANDLGLIRIGRPKDRLPLVAQIAQAFPSASIAIAAIRQKDVQAIERALTKAGFETHAILSDGVTGRSSRIAITTPCQMWNPDLNLARRNMLICWDALESLGGDSPLMFTRVERVRVFGFLPLDRTLAPRDAAQIRCHFGFSEIDVPRPYCRRLPVSVAFLHSEGFARSTMAGSPFELVKTGVWLNPGRNNQLIRLANALLHSAPSRIASSFPQVAASLPIARPQRIALLVDGLDHAFRLLPKLPGWRLAAGPTDNSLFSQHERALWARTELPSAAAVVTSTAAANFDWPKIDVLVRADGGIGVPPGLDKSVIENTSARRVLLLDLADRHHPLLRKRSRSRRNAYLRAGWYAPGADPVRERVRGFLAEREVCHGQL